MFVYVFTSWFAFFLGSLTGGLSLQQQRRHVRRLSLCASCVLCICVSVYLQVYFSLYLCLYMCLHLGSHSFLVRWPAVSHCSSSSGMFDATNYFKGSPTPVAFFRLLRQSRTPCKVQVNTTPVRSRKKKYVCQDFSANIPRLLAAEFGDRWPQHAAGAREPLQARRPDS